MILYRIYYISIKWCSYCSCRVTVTFDWWTKLAKSSIRVSYSGLHFCGFLACHVVSRKWNSLLWLCFLVYIPVACSCELTLVPVNLFKEILIELLLSDGLFSLSDEYWWILRDRTLGFKAIARLLSLNNV